MARRGAGEYISYYPRVFFVTTFFYICRLHVITQLIICTGISMATSRLILVQWQHRQNYLPQAANPRWRRHQQNYDGFMGSYCQGAGMDRVRYILWAFSFRIITIDDIVNDSLLLSIYIYICLSPLQIMEISTLSEVVERVKMFNSQRKQISAWRACVINIQDLISKVPITCQGIRNLYAALLILCASHVLAEHLSFGCYNALVWDCPLRRRQAGRLQKRLFPSTFVGSLL